MLVVGPSLTLSARKDAMADAAHIVEDRINFSSGYHRSIKHASSTEPIDRLTCDFTDGSEFIGFVHQGQCAVPKGLRPEI